MSPWCHYPNPPTTALFSCQKTIISIKLPLLWSFVTCRSAAIPRSECREDVGKETRENPGVCWGRGDQVDIHKFKKFWVWVMKITKHFPSFIYSVPTPQPTHQRDMQSWAFAQSAFSFCALNPTRTSSEWLSSPKCTKVGKVHGTHSTVIREGWPRSTFQFLSY